MRWVDGGRGVRREREPVVEVRRMLWWWGVGWGRGVGEGRGRRVRVVG